MRPVAQTPQGLVATTLPGLVAQTPPEADLSFMAGWRKSTELLATTIERYVFESREDGLLKVAMKARKTPSDVFSAYDSAKEKLDVVLAEVANETAEQSKPPDRRFRPQHRGAQALMAMMRSTQCRRSC